MDIRQLGDPEFVGTVPARSDLTVIGPDKPKPKEIGFTCHFVEGGEVFLFHNDDEPFGPTIPNDQDLVVGSTVLVPTLWGGYSKMVVTGEDRAEDDFNVAVLFRSKDDRQCWVSDTMINKNLKKNLREILEIGGSAFLIGVSFLQNGVLALW